MPLRIGTQIQALPRSTLTSGSHPGSVVPAGHAPPDLIQKSSYASADTGMRPVLCSASTDRTHFQNDCGLAWRSANDIRRNILLSVGRMMTHMQGRFVWSELIPTDTASAVEFYRQVIGCDDQGSGVEGWYDTI